VGDDGRKLTEGGEALAADELRLGRAELGGRALERASSTQVAIRRNQ
jgi:hypothetical protein